MSCRSDNFDDLTILRNKQTCAAARLSAEIGAEVVRIMRERRAHGLPTYRLAQIGNALGPQLRELERLNGRRLVDIVQDDLGYEIVVSACQPGAPFVRTDGLAPPPVPRRRIPDELWLAFTTPLPARMTRDFLRDARRHRDSGEAVSPAADCVPIPRPLIHPAPQRHLFDAVARTIQDWAGHHQVTWSDPAPRDRSLGMVVRSLPLARQRSSRRPFGNGPRDVALAPTVDTAVFL
jgi:hypothetical protein